MRLADVGVLSLIFMLLARILAPISIVYLLPGSAVADEAVRLIEVTADVSFLMLLIALLMFWTIKKRWDPDYGSAWPAPSGFWCFRAQRSFILSTRLVSLQLEPSAGRCYHRECRRKPRHFPKLLFKRLAVWLIQRRRLIS